MKFESCLAFAFQTAARKLYGRFLLFFAPVNAVRLGAAAMVLAAGSLTSAHAQMTATNPVFPATAVGSVATPQTVLLTTTSAETITSITVPVSQGNKQEYTVGGVSGCAVDGSTVNPAGTVCQVPITFAPAYPGARVAPLRVVTGAGNINFALSATGNGPLSVLSPGLNAIIAGGCTTNCAARDADGVLASTETLSVIYDMRLNSAGDIYFINAPGLRKISGSTGIVTTIAGIGSGSSSLTLAPLAIALDPRGNIDAAEFNPSYGYSLVQQVNGATGAVTTIAGKFYQSTNTDPNIPTPGPATQSPLPALSDVASDAPGNVYIATASQILRIDAVTGVLSYFAGTPNVKNYSGDGGLATTALVNTPTGIAFDVAGNLYFSDSANFVVRRIDAITGIITTVAGNPNGTENEAYVGPATGTLIAPRGLAFDAAGNLYLNDQIGSFLGVRRVDAATNIMTTIAGYSKPIPRAQVVQRATDALNVSGFALDSLGNLITYTSGSLGAISKVDTSTSAINFPYTSSTAAAVTPYIGVAYPNATAENVNYTSIGNTTLSIASPSTGSTPAVAGAAFKLNDPATSGCRSIAAGAASASLAPGTSCFLAVDFVPTVAGTNSGQIGLTDNSLNAPGSGKTISLMGAGAPLPLTLSPTALTFPDTVIGSSSPTQTITVNNVGGATTLMVAVSITGANASSFSQSNTCGTYIFAASSCTITIAFSPTAVATGLNAVVSLASDYPTPPPTATLAGNGVPAGTLTISPTVQAFPSTTVGATSAIQTSTISNTTAQAIYLSSGSLTDATDFTQSDNCNGLLAAGKTCTVSFTFTPKTAGALSSTYAIHDLNNPGTPLAVALSGTGNAVLVPQAVLSAQYLNFTTVPNTQAYNQTLTLSNPGTGTLNIASILLTGTNVSSFAIVTNACGGTLNAGAACNITVGCTAIVTGTYTASLTVTDNATPPTQSAYLTCTVAGTAQASLAPAAVTFGNVNVGAKSAASTIILTNAGTAALGINSISLQGTNAASYAIAGNACGLSLAAGASCAVTVTFSPTAAGSTSATLTVIDAVGTQTSALSGTGVATVAPDFTIAATSAQKAYRGTSVSYTVQLTSLLPSNPFGSAVTLSATGLPKGTTVSFAPVTLVPGAATASTSVMTVTIPPLAAALQVPVSPSRWPGGKLPEGATVLTALALCVMRRSKGRGLQRLLSAVLMLGGMATAAMLSGCGATNGFGVPTTTSVITVTATSGTTVHSTQVTLTIL